MTSIIPPHWLAPSPPVPVDEYDPEQRPEAEPDAPEVVLDPDEVSARSSTLG